MPAYRSLNRCLPRFPRDCNNVDYNQVWTPVTLKWTVHAIRSRVPEVEEQNNTNNPHILQLARTQNTQLNKENTLNSVRLIEFPQILPYMYVRSMMKEENSFFDKIFFDLQAHHSKAYDECLKLVDSMPTHLLSGLEIPWLFKLF